MDGYLLVDDADSIYLRYCCGGGSYTMKTYSFVEQLEQGEEYEQVLDEYFKRWYTIEPVDQYQQRKGIDRVFSRPDGSSITVEYKADSKTQDTGNVFVETWSVYELGRYGWAWTSTADTLIYLAIPDTIYMVYPYVIREHLEFWRTNFGEKSVRNKGYTSRGIPVPEKVFSKACFGMRRLS